MNSEQDAVSTGSDMQQPCRKAEEPSQRVRADLGFSGKLGEPFISNSEEGTLANSSTFQDLNIEAGGLVNEPFISNPEEEGTLANSSTWFPPFVLHLNEPNLVPDWMAPPSAFNPPPAYIPAPDSIPTQSNFSLSGLYDGVGNYNLNAVDLGRCQDAQSEIACLPQPPQIERATLGVRL